MNPTADYAKDYNGPSFWKKVKMFAGVAGREVISKALLLYYCYRDPKTPAWIKGILLGALGYFVAPLDALPDAIPIAGFTDDLGALAAVTALVAVHLNKAHADAARQKLAQWFG